MLSDFEKATGDFKNKNYRQAIRIYERGLQNCMPLSDKIEYIRGLSSSYVLLGELERDNNNIIQGINTIEEFITLNPYIGDENISYLNEVKNFAVNLQSQLSFD